MRCEIPVLLRCCFCFPLRYGLLVWSYIKQIFSILFLTFVIHQLYQMSHRRTGVETYVLSSLLLILTIVDIVFHILFIKSTQKKEYKKIRIFYRYSIVLLCLFAVMMCLYIVFICAYFIHVSPIILILLWTHLLPGVVMIVALLIIQSYLIILVRSEFIKLKNNSQFEFVNDAAKEKCTANIDFVKEIPASVYDNEN
ncbi:uncharacterized protein LOC120631475 [Pararge aegeria]|uniref:Jg15332 protein n=1 Tax=Pararge aegeria aegeria TaxID=348720 RepID=A0A8S4RIV3_9NEOP|nr:uncharacterized protein LOC120631475 [Pararge aegeria]CAH2236573.1 jg15332 [Pararge aegeria aegeria]